MTKYMFYAPCKISLRAVCILCRGREYFNLIIKMLLVFFSPPCIHNLHIIFILDNYLKQKQKQKN